MVLRSAVNLRTVVRYIVLAVVMIYLYGIVYYTLSLCDFSSNHENVRLSAVTTVSGTARAYLKQVV